jgi:hypothetical protein
MCKLARRIMSLANRLCPREQDQSGQSLIIVAFAFLGLVAMLGIALDLGLVYIERVRMKRAVDAATLAGVVELPFEQESFERAMEYLDLNGYTMDRTDIYVIGCIRDPVTGDLENSPDPVKYHEHQDPLVEPSNVFTFNTRVFQTANEAAGDFNCKESESVKIFGTANKLLITGTTWVDMNFMQFFGFGQTAVGDSAVAQNVSSLDVAVVMDRTGSMDFDTICFNCFQRTEEDAIDNADYVRYPENGERYPVPEVDTSNLCLADEGDVVAPILFNTYHYQILEAELYSLNSSTWERRFRTTGQGYWTPNRKWTDAWRPPPNIDTAQTGPGAVSHQPFVTFTDNTTSSPLFGRFYTLADAQSGIAPRLEYDFALPDSWNSTTANIWIRARQNDEYPGWSKELNGTTNPDVIYWAVNNGVPTKADNTQGNGVGTNWTWVKLGSVSALAKHNGPGYIWHTLKIWAGSPGYTIDRIIITDNSTNSSLPNQITSNPSQANPQNDTSGGRRNWTTPGSARRQACDPCNPIFGLNITDPRTQDEGGQCAGFYKLYGPTDNLANDLFSDNQPIRGSKEAIKNFVGRLDPQFDQVGFVYYNDTAQKGSELMCRRRYGADCYEGPASWGWPGGLTPYSYTVVLNSVEDQWSANGTCTACGIRAGLEVLGINVDNRNQVDNKCDGSPDSACGRGAAATRIMVLLTDGVPNVNPGGVCDDDPNLWPNGGGPHDCGIYYAKKAAEAGVVIYTIGLGNGPDIPWLQAIAEETKGQFYQAPSPNDLDLIFDEILSNIYVRLIR